MPTKNYEACIKIGKYDLYPGKEAGIQIACERNQMSELTGKDFNIAIINPTELKKRITKIKMMSHQTNSTRNGSY